MISEPVSPARVIAVPIATVEDSLRRPFASTVNVGIVVAEP